MDSETTYSRSEEHTSELQSRSDLVCRLLLEKKKAYDFSDEIISVTEKLIDELAQCYNVLPQLDINNTIDHRPEGDEKWFLENEKTVTQFCRKLAAERPLKDIRDEYNSPNFFFKKYASPRFLHSSPTRPLPV